MYQSIKRSIPSFDSPVNLSLSINSLNIPVLAVWGTNDQVTPFSGSNRLLEVMPSTELKVIEGGTHNITFVQPTKIGKMIVSFLEGK